MENTFNLAAWAAMTAPAILASGKTSYDNILEQELPLDIYANEGNVVICASLSVVGRLERGRVLGRINCGSRFKKSYKSQEEANKDPEYLRHLKNQRELALAVVKEINNDRLLAIAVCAESKKSGSTPKAYDPNLIVSSLAVARDYFERLRELHGLPEPAQAVASVADETATAPPATM